MSTYHKLTYHVVFSVKFRRKLILPSFRERLYEYIGGTIRAVDGHLIEIGGIEDHIHLLTNLSPKHAISNVIRDVKANSSKWVNENHFSNEKFAWQKGYAIFTVSESQIEPVRTYIQNQEEHHRQKTFRDEYVAMLVRHGINYDESHLFEGEYA